MSPLLSIAVRWDGADVIVALSGELDLLTAPEAQDRISEVGCQHPARLILDLAALSFADASGLGALVRARTAIPPGSSLVLRSPSSTIRAQLRVTGLDQIAAIEEADAPA